MSRKTVLIGVAAVATAGVAAVGYAQITSFARTLTPEKPKRPSTPPPGAGYSDQVLAFRALFEADPTDPNVPAYLREQWLSELGKPAAKPAAKPQPAKPAAKPQPAKPSVVQSIPVHAVHVTNIEQPKPAEPKRRTAKQAAEQLYTLATAAIRSGQSAKLGTLAHPNEQIRIMQTDMRGIKADGVYYKKTQARGKELLGKPFPTRPEESLHEAHAALPAPQPVVRALPAPKPQPVAVKPAAKPAARTVAKPAAKPQPAKPAATDDAPTRAARQLDKYIAVDGGRSRAVIADAQWLLGLDTDGIPGPMTRGRVGRLLLRSVDWPRDIEILTTGAAPGGKDARSAADRIVRYVRELHGSKPERIKAYQLVMGVDPAGVVGPKTKARVFALNGEQL